MTKATKATKTTKTKRAWLPCPGCESQHSEVVRVMQTVGNRQRRCLACGEVFLTIESVRRATGVNSSVLSATGVINTSKNTPV